jgi:hypothetical protein
MKEEEIHRIEIGDVKIEYIGRIISVKGININSGLSPDMVKQVGGMKQEITKGFLILVFILLSLYGISLYLISFTVFKIFSFVLPFILGIIIHRWWSNEYVIIILIILLIVLSLIFQGEITIKQIVDIIMTIRH